MTRLVTLVLAAGSSSRFDGCKLLADAAGVPVLGRVLQQAKACFGESLYLISGRWHHEILAAMSTGYIAEVPVVFHPNWALGMGQTISFAVNQLADSYDGVVILLADQIDIKTTDFFELKDAFKDVDGVCAFYDGKRGAPAIFSSTLFAELKRLSGEQGAKSVLYNSNYRISEVSMASAVFDIDTKEALWQWLIIYQGQSKSAV